MEGQYGGGGVARPCVQQGLLSPAYGVGLQVSHGNWFYDVTVKTPVFLGPLIWERMVSGWDRVRGGQGEGLET